MSDKKKISKKSLQYARPERGKFTLNAVPNKEFIFRKVTIDDNAWVESTFGCDPWEMITNGKIEAAKLCRLYFHFLEDKDKALFPPERVTVKDFENGGESEELITGPRKFMQAIDGGTAVELILIGNAFLTTLIASRPMNDLPDDVKKSLQKGLQLQKEKAELSEAKESTT